MSRSINTTELKLIGAEEVKALLKSLPEKVATKIQRKAMRDALKDLKTDVSQRVPVKSGALKASIKTSVRKTKAGVSGSVKAGDDVAWYAHLIEYGFVHTDHSGRPTSAGHIPGKKFMRAAIESQAQGIVDKFMDGVREAAEEAK